MFSSSNKIKTQIVHPNLNKQTKDENSADHDQQQQQPEQSKIKTLTTTLGPLAMMMKR